LERKIRGTIHDLCAAAWTLFGEERGATHHTNATGRAKRAGWEKKTAGPPSKNRQAQLGGASHDGKQESDGWRYRRFQA
jgi:hypothetical protein